MDESSQAPLRSFYKELGIPVAGEGEFANVKPGTQVRPLPGPLDRIREFFDPEYASAKKLFTTQQAYIQDLAAAAPLLQQLRSQEIPTLAEAKAIFPDFPVPPRAFERAGPGGGFDMTTPLPLASQRHLGALEHQASLRQPVPRQVSGTEATTLMGMDAEIQAHLEKHGEYPNAEQRLEMLRRVTGSYEKAPQPGSLGEQKLKGEADLATGKAARIDEKEEQELLKGKLETQKLHQDIKNEAQIFPYKIDKLLADIDLAKTQASTIGQKAELSDLLAKVTEARGQFQMALAGIKEGWLDTDMGPRAIANIYNRLGGDLEMSAPERTFIQKHIPGFREPALKLSPKDQPKSLEQGTPRKPEKPTAPPAKKADPLKGAPPPGKPGAILKKKGKAIARSDGQKWILLGD